MELIGYQPCLADPDMWMRDAVKSNGTKCYEYVLLYVGDCLVIGENAKSQIKEIDKYFTMNQFNRSAKYISWSKNRELRAT